jgi:hypothetical protein
LLKGRSNLQILKHCKFWVFKLGILNQYSLRKYSKI